MKTVLLISCDNAIQAHIFQGALENEGIPSVLKNEEMGNFFSYNRVIGGVDILVYERDLERAREILERNAQEEGLDEDFDVNGE